MKLRKVAAGTAAGAALIVGMAATAWAHVTVDPESVPQGASDATLTFRVPNEKPSADTTQVDIQFPTDHPIAVVDPAAPTDGWTVKVTTKHLDTPIKTDDGTFSDVVSEVLWSGGKIAPGQYGEFKVLAQGIPDGVDTLSFPTIQTYSDGTTVSWIEPTAEGQPAPENPTPVLKLTPAVSEASTTSNSTSSSEAAAPATTTVVKKQTNNGLAIAALIVGGVALVLAGAGLVRRRS